MSIEAKPFLKWAGGKGQLLSQLDEHLPKGLQGQEFTYIEPFVGGGAMLFHILRKFTNISHAVINDINPHLMTAYRVIKDQPYALIERLSVLERDYLSLKDEEERKEYFLNIRKTFNEQTLDEIDRTQYLIFLNHTCFNGLYRVNAKGKFNVPFGQYLHPNICNAETILADSRLLSQTKITMLNGDFESTADLIGDGLCFFYFDPPYRPLNATSSFNSYAKEEFDDSEQIRLRDFCRHLNTLPNVRWMQSNADCSAKNPNDTFFEENYTDFYISRVYAARFINANPNKRGKLTELIIKNYEQGFHPVYVSTAGDQPAARLLLRL